MLVDIEKWYFAAAQEEAIVIEDSSRGLKAAQAAGIDCIIIKKLIYSFSGFKRSKGGV